MDTNQFLIQKKNIQFKIKDLIENLNVTKRDYQLRIDSIDKELTQTEELLAINLEKLKVEELN